MNKKKKAEKMTTIPIQPPYSDANTQNINNVGVYKNDKVTYLKNVINCVQKILTFVLKLMAPTGHYIHINYFI